MTDEKYGAARYRICVVNGVFVSGGSDDDGRVRPPHVFSMLAEHLAATTGMRAVALWPYCERHVFNLHDFAALTRRSMMRYGAYLAEGIREEVARNPLSPGETLAFVVYSGGVPVVQTAAHLLRSEVRTGAYVFFGPALRPRMAPRNWADGTQVGVVLGAHDWVQGVYPRVPRPWQHDAQPRMLSRLQSNLPPETRYHTLQCNHWPGYFTPETWPALVNAITDLLVPGTTPVNGDQTGQTGQAA